VDCTCGDDCQCTETLCRCEASSVLNSLQAPSIAVLTVRGMTCQSCVKTVAAVCNTNAESVDLTSGNVQCEVHSRQEALGLVKDLQNVGFEATLERVGMNNTSTVSCHNGGDSTTSSCQNRSTEAPPTSSPCSQSSNHDSPLFDGSPSSTTLQDPLLEPPPQEEQVVEMVVGGMTCTMCSTAITRALEGVDGVTSANVNLTTNVATIHFKSPQITPRMLQETIEGVGYQVQDILDNEEDADTRLQDLARRQQEEVLKKKRAFLYSLIGTLPIFCMTMILPSIMPNSIKHYLHSTIHIFGYDLQRESLVLWVLATPVQFFSGWTFYKGTYYNIQSGSLGMDVLVALGTTASYSYAVYEVLCGEGGHFFETSSVLLSFVLLGKWMNSLAVRRTSEALTKLMNLQSKRAIRVTPKVESTRDWDPTKDAYDEEIVDIRLVQPNDTVKVLRGASIPADGVVSHGEMTVDESMITGESIPVLKLPGSIVLGGTVCVEAEQAAGFVHVTGVGSSTALAQIVQLVQDAQTRQVPIQSLADTISSVFVPTVCACSLLTYMVWYALCSSGVVPEDWFMDEGAGTFSLMFGIACLVISCPCALGLATPTVSTILII